MIIKRDVLSSIVICKTINNFKYRDKGKLKKLKKLLIQNKESDLGYL